VNNISFGQKLKILREEKKLTQKELAKKINVSAKTISRYESGESKPRYNKVYDDIAEVLNVNKGDLVDAGENFVLNIRDEFGNKDANSANSLVDGMIGLMAGGEISDDDKRVILETLQEAFILAKNENKKYTTKRYRLTEKNVGQN
jgi:transcriptional regulator with XRE-family HTH domain